MSSAFDDEMAKEDLLTLVFPSVDEEDPLFRRKKILADPRNLNFKFQIKVPSARGEVLQMFDQILCAARILHLNEVELYFAEDDYSGPFSPRNELESLNFVLAILKPLVFCSEAKKTEVLQVLVNAACDMIRTVGTDNIVEKITEKSAGDAEVSLLKWGRNHGLRTKLGISYWIINCCLDFEGAGRGAVALEGLNIGDIALEVPESLIISEDVVCESEMGIYVAKDGIGNCFKYTVLKEMDGMSAETMLLLWSMGERDKSNSKFKTYFEALPEEFHTGLSFGIDALGTLEGTLLFEELLQAREHLRQQYDELCPTLCSNYPDIFPPELYSWDQFRWACELWYSNSMKVVLSDGKLKTCLVPFAGLLNHSLCPHILHYGRVDLESKSLKFQLSRPCKAGEQCYLSYGSFPGSHFVTFYGFLPKGDNPYDVIPLDFAAADAEGGNVRPCFADVGWTTHMLRGTWLCKSLKPRTYGLPPPLLVHLRTMLKDDDNELPTETSEQDVNERAVLETVLSIFNPMMEELVNSDDFDREESAWDVKLALDYKDLQRRIISSVLASCTSGLNMLF